MMSLAQISPSRRWIFFSVLFLASCLAEDGLVTNGDFEESIVGLSPENGGEELASLPGWKINGKVNLISRGQKQGDIILVVPRGSHAIRLGNEAEVSQYIKVEKGNTYSFTFFAARTCAQLESLNVSVLPTSQTIDLQTLYSVEGWNCYALAFQSQSDDARLVFQNPGMEEDPTCGPILDSIAIKKLFIPDKPKDNAVLNGDMEEGPWMFKNVSLGVLLPTNLDEETSSLPGWIVESERAVRYVDSGHYSTPQGKRAVELLSGKEGIISQMAETVPNKQNVLTFSFGQGGDSCKRPLAVMAFAGDQSESIHFSPTGNMTYQTVTLNFTAKAERTRIAFSSVYYNQRTDDGTSLCGPVIDDVRVRGVSRSHKVLGRSNLGLAVVILALILA